MPSKRTTYDGALVEVKHAFGIHIYKEMGRFLASRQPNWWGSFGAEDMAKLMLLATCMHDARGYSYHSIIRALKPKLLIYSKALQHNVKLTREVLAAWGNKNIFLPTPDKLNASVRDLRMPAWMKDVRWWIDSTDIPLDRKKKFRSRKGSYWSGKLGRPAWRYMTLRDGSGRIRKMWGGYSPKTYDSEFMRIEQQFFKENLAGSAILADTHFFAARDHIRDPDILATPPPNCSVDLLTMRGFSTTTAEAEKKSADITSKRGVVETAYARTKGIFIPLAGGPHEKWREPETQLDFVVTWAFGVHNRLCDLLDK